ncbi:apoptosis-inducing factor 1, mitochondrial-like [Saccostrea echinata]|uniref:apoptosis-inducing factor 1, mitochondrial-like n=1 Tax=Saccostrea echinata TaxID=191078 RepID=UPI002A829281|nr:apoptosis-inducing factor 1, mitochondrial-like [Saccostrea echinata]
MYRLVPLNRVFTRTISSVTRKLQHKKCTPDHLCIRCLSNWSDNRGKEHDWSSRNRTYAAVAATSLASLYMLTKTGRTEEDQWFCYTAQCETKHVVAGVVPGAKQSTSATEESKPTESTENKGETSTPEPPFYKYLIVGAGTSSVAAYRAIKARDPKAKVLIIGDEPDVPYERPPLSKELWYIDKNLAQNYKFGKGKRDTIFYEPRPFYLEPEALLEAENGGVGLISGKKVVKLDSHKKKVWLNDGSEILYDKCLLATGGRPKNHPVMESAEKDVQDRTILFRNTSDFTRLYEAVENSKSVAIIGGGFLGSELACALGFKGLKVHQIIQEKGNLGTVLPEYLSKHTTDKVRESGVDVITNQTVTGAQYTDNQVELTLEDGSKILVDNVVVSVGLEPNVDLAKSSNLEVDEKHGGFRVNAELEAMSDVWVAGDVSCFYDIKLGRRRIEHHNHAWVSGKLAGENMTGAAKMYRYQSIFWSDLEPYVSFQAIGIIDSNLETYAVFERPQEKKKKRKKKSKENSSAVTNQSGEAKKSQETKQSETISKDPKSTVVKPEEFNKGVIFYIRGGSIVGVLLWNISGKIYRARQVLSDGCKDEDLYEVAKLFFAPRKCEE